MPQFTCPTCGSIHRVERLGDEVQCFCGAKFLPVAPDVPSPAAPSSARWLSYLLLLVSVGILVAGLIWVSSQLRGFARHQIEPRKTAVQLPAFAGGRSGWPAS